MSPRKKSAATSSSASLNKSSEGRTTIHAVSNLVAGNVLISHQRRDVKGTTPGMLTSVLWEQLQNEYAAVVKVPDVKELSALDFNPHSVDLGNGVMLYAAILVTWKQCPMCGSDAEHSKEFCEGCKVSSGWTAQDTKDYSERRK